MSSPKRCARGSTRTRCAPSTPGVGFAAGIERMLLAVGDVARERQPAVFIAIAKPDAGRLAFQLAGLLRREGFRTEVEQAGRSMKGQLKQADRIGAYATVILGDTIEVKDMASGEQQEAPSAADVPSLLRSVHESEIS